MKNNLLIIGLVVLVLGGGAFVLSQPKSPTPFGVTEPTPTYSGVIGKDDDTTIERNSRYIEYSPEAFQAAEGKRRVLFFYANWCPTCRPADAAFEANMSQIPEDVVLFRVNYNDPDTDQAEKDLATKHGVTYQHTYVQVDAGENAVTTWNGGQINELLENIQ